MFLVNYLFGFTLVFVVFGVVVLGVAVAPYQGVIALMGVSFFCCMLMVMIGRMFAALVVYIVYLGGLVVVFGYCVSVEKGQGGVFKVDGFNYLVVFLITTVVVGLGVVLFGGFGGLWWSFSWGDVVCLEVNGGGVFYFGGGAGLVVCSWGLLVVLFSVLVVLSWTRFGGLRPF